MHGGPSPFPGGPAFYHGRLPPADSEVVASGFSPRLFSMPSGAGEHPSTAHKRQAHAPRAEYLPATSPTGGEVAITIPAAATWHDPSQVEERGQLSQPVPAESSRPLPEKSRVKVKVDVREDPFKGRAGLGVAISKFPLFQDLRKLPGGAVAVLQSSLTAVLGRSQRPASSSRSSIRHSIQRSGSMLRSPTVMKNIHSLSGLAEEGDVSSGQARGHLADGRMERQTLLPVGVFGLVFVFWLFKGRPLVSLFHAFPAEEEQNPPGSTWVELLALCLILVIAGALLRSASPHLVAQFRSRAAAGGWGWHRELPSLARGWGKPSSLALDWGQGRSKATPGLGAFAEKRKTSFEMGRGSWEYLGATRGSPTSSSYGEMSQPSSPDALPPGSPNRALHCAIHTYSNGDRYEGEFYQGKCSGSGVYIFATSGRYEGDWVEGKYDGSGIETWLRGSSYRGHYRKGLREGYGVYRFYTGDVYSGMWSRGQSHGVGVQTCSDGSKYVGNFQWGAKHGTGKYTFRNGDVYTGEYFADKMHGYGVYEFSNGHRYEGAWHEGRKQGLGVYTFRNGEERAGHWHLGALETRSMRSGASTPTSPNAVNHSRVLHAVQEARRAASRAELIPRVEDRVSKAVAAANRAAVAARIAASKAVQSEGAGGQGGPLAQGLSQNMTEP